MLYRYTSEALAPQVFDLLALNVFATSYTCPMRFRCIVSYRTSRSKSILMWRTTTQGKDIGSVVADIIAKLRRRQRRAVSVTGMYVQLQE